MTFKNDSVEKGQQKAVEMFYNRLRNSKNTWKLTAIHDYALDPKLGCER